MGEGVAYARPGTKFLHPPGFIRYLEMEVQLCIFILFFASTPCFANPAIHAGTNPSITHQVNYATFVKNP